MNRISGILGSVALVAVVLAGCGGSDLVLPGEGTPAELRVVKGDNQRGPAGSALSLPLEVEVRDNQGLPLPGHSVAFAIDPDAPGARVNPETARSGSNGVASTSWVLGATVGTQNVVARVARPAPDEPLEVRFSALAGAAGATTMAIAGGDDQVGPAGRRLANPLVVLISDGFGNPVEGVTVEWTAASGTVDPGSSVTGSDGRAETSWSLGSTTGPQSATASSAGLSGSPLTFDATALSGNANRLVRVSGNEQSARAGSELPAPLVVRLTDDAGNGVPNRAVSWIVASGGGDVGSTTSSTDSEGEATARWTIGPNPGGNTLNAVVSGVGFVTFIATGTSSGGGGGGGGGGGDASPTRLEFRVQPSDTEKRKRISPAVEVEVLDQNGNRVTDEGVEVKLELTGDDDGKLKGHEKERSRDGVATFDDIKIDEEGEYRLRASADGLPSVESDFFEVYDD